MRIYSRLPGKGLKWECLVWKLGKEGTAMRCDAAMREMLWLLILNGP